MKLIINADDFGYDRGINLGIVDAYELGFLTSTTMMVTMSGTEHAVQLKKSYPGLGVGLHLNFSLGEPITDGKTLVGENGKLIKPDLVPADHIYDYDEVTAEIRAQYKRFLDLTDTRPTHLDSHLFSTDKIYVIKEAAINFAEEVKLPLRNHNISNFRSVKFIQHRTFNSTPDLSYVLDNFEDIKKYEYAEIMCHPGYVDQYLLDNSSYNTQRCGELAFLTSTENKDFFEKNSVEFITYDGL